MRLARVDDFDIVVPDQLEQRSAGRLQVGWIRMPEMNAHFSGALRRDELLFRPKEVVGADAKGLTPERCRRAVRKSRVNRTSASRSP
jgi:hypothetical protein